MDTAARIGITFCLMTGALFLLCLACILREHRRGQIRSRKFRKFRRRQLSR